MSECLELADSCHFWNASHPGICAAWAVRNARGAGRDGAMMITWICYEVRLVLEGGELLESVVPSLVNLFSRP